MADPSQTQAGGRANPLVAILVLGGVVAMAGAMGTYLWRDGGQEPPLSEQLKQADQFAKDNFRPKQADRAPQVGADWRRKCEDEQKIFEIKLGQIASDYFTKSGTQNDHTRKDVLLFLADAYRRAENQWALAEKNYRLAAQEPMSPPHTAAHPMSQMEIYYHIAESLYHLQRYPEAETALRQALAEASRSTLSEGGLSYWKHETDYLLAETLIEEGKLEEAEELLKSRQKVDLDPYSKALLLKDCAMLDAKRGKNQEAEQGFAAALKSFDTINGTVKGTSSDNDRKVAMLLDDYAKLLRQMKQPQKAYELAHRSRAIRDNPPPGLIIPQ